MECNRIIHSFSSSDRFCVVGISRKGPQVIRSLVRKNYLKVGIKSMFIFNTACKIVIKITILHYQITLFSA